jgi:hypothetical protein
MGTVTIKDPHATLDYPFNWSGWLEPSETISNYTITAAAGITVNSHSESSGIVTVWLSGGTAGNSYSVACKIETSLDRIDERTRTIQVQHR